MIDAFNGNVAWQKCAKIWLSVLKLQPKTCSKITAEMLMKQSNIFCAIYFMLEPLRTVQIDS
jgi:hypothetical protein